MLRLAYVASHLTTYYAQEHDIFRLSKAGLTTLSKDLSFELYAPEPVVTREDAMRVANDLESAGVDFVLLQSSSFVMGDVVLEFAGRSFRLGIWATEEPTKEGPILLNNFVSMNLNAGILKRYLQAQSIPFKWFYGDTEHKWFKPRLEITLAALRAIKRLSQAKVALIGGIAPTFYNLTVIASPVHASSCK